MSEAFGRSHETHPRREPAEAGSAPVGELKPFPAPRIARASEAGGALLRGTHGRTRTAAAGLSMVLLLGLAGQSLAHYLTFGRFIVSTDDAYVRTDLAIVSPKIYGSVETLAVVDNQHVKAGELLARIEAGDYQLAVAAARQKALTQDAAIARIKAQAAAQESMVAQAMAQLDAAKAETTRAEADLGRIQTLAAADFATRQRYDQSLADRDKAAAATAATRAMLAGARANLLVLQSQVQEAENLRAELSIAQARAERDLSFTEIRAPFDGIVGNRAAEPGQYVQPGARMMALAPDDHSYVEANFKETQLARLAPGQKARVRIDAYDGRTFEGIVESIAPASGAQFSLLPPENATGNFTRITQRFPVRLRISPLSGAPMRAGLSVVVDVDTRDGAE